MRFFKNLTKEQISIQIFIFCKAVIAGLVLMGVNSSFFGMLYERGITLKSMSVIPIATAPYSLKFLVSPYIKNLICVKHFSLTVLVRITQITIFVLFSSLGFIKNNMFFATLNVFLLTLTISIYDIIATHIKLISFNSNQFGIVTALSTVGFRIGMLFGGGGLAYLAYYFGWRTGFCVSAGALMLINMVLTPHFLNICEPKNPSDENQSGCRQLFVLIKNFVVSTGAIGVILLILSVKIPDTSLHTTKQMFLLFKGFDKVQIANISQIPGVFAMIIGGIAGGIATYKYAVNVCMSFSLAFFASSCALFYWLSCVNLGVWITAFILTISSFSCGFLNVVFRTFVDKYSQKDVNKNVLLISLGSLFKLVFANFSLLIANNNNWGMLYILCVLSTIPGIIICFKSNWLKKIG